MACAARLSKAGVHEGSPPHQPSPGLAGFGALPGGILRVEDRRPNGPRRGPRPRPAYPSAGSGAPAAGLCSPPGPCRPG
eukprot:5546563-Alexandrium_andersonii.AAC.1